MVIKEANHASFGDIGSIRNEVEALKNVKGAYLPQVLDFLRQGDSSYTVLEFIEGESFDKLIERGESFDESQVIKWYGQLASALETIHGREICHCDIKPANIMLTPGGDVCLIDFNAALVGGDDTRRISRSAGYASPEQHELFKRFAEMKSKPANRCCRCTGTQCSCELNTHCNCEFNTLRNRESDTQLSVGDSTTQFSDAHPRGQSCSSCCGSMPPGDSGSPAPTLRDIDWKRSDIYSLGAAMYHILTGKRPSERAPEPVVPSKSRQSSKDIECIINRAMRRDPSERFADASKLAEALEALDINQSRLPFGEVSSECLIDELAFAIEEDEYKQEH